MRPILTIQNIKDNAIVVIPARGGSKGIPLKNICPVAGKPLLVYTIEAARLAGLIQRTFVSTDSPEIAAVARQFGASVIDRPAAIAHDTASTESALLHAVDTVGATLGNRTPDYVLTLPATSPLRTSATIERCLTHFAEVADRFDALVTLTESNADYWEREDDGTYCRLFPNAPRRRQDRKSLYVENSALYLTARAALKSTGSVLGTACTAVVIDEIEGTDINSPRDLAWVEFLMRGAAPVAGA